jgi:hypothetical protein
MRMYLSLAAVGAMAFAAVPAAAQHHGSGHHASRHAHHAKWSRGHHLGHNYSYTSFNALPRTYVTRYRLSPHYRYVYTDGYIYQVDPRTYAITQVLQALTAY